ncbi:hypothetical protein [Flavobacterium denitrificans]|uniref:hypothetical protein n=1 Tax=Flavobacterium denitrificans TaxID=281361 RepID=UPI000425FC11|nr:hypothetical protein [Flavobacterium denitrificans]
MKKIGLLLVFFISLVSCSNDDKDNKAVANSDYYGKWVRVSNPAANSIGTLEPYYVFKEDMTFVKMIPYEKNVSFSGTFQIIKNDSGTHFHLTYPSKNDWISTCIGGTLEEAFTLNDSGNLVDQAGMCDRYGIFTKEK